MAKRVITAKFNSTCAETGRQIKAGDLCVYDSATQKVYARGSNTQVEFVTGAKPTAYAQAEARTLEIILHSINNPR